MADCDQLGHRQLLPRERCAEPAAVERGAYAGRVKFALGPFERRPGPERAERCCGAREQVGGRPPAALAAQQLTQRELRERQLIGASAVLEQLESFPERCLRTLHLAARGEEPAAYDREPRGGGGVLARGRQWRVMIEEGGRVLQPP